MVTGRLAGDVTGASLSQRDRLPFGVFTVGSLATEDVVSQDGFVSRMVEDVPDGVIGVVSGERDESRRPCADYIGQDH